MSEVQKRCWRCNSYKNIDKFYPAKAKSHGVGSICKKCSTEYAKERREANPESKMRARITNKKRREKDPEKFRNKFRNDNLKRNYGITSEDYYILYERQNGRCLICKKHESEVDWHYKTLTVDHCHDTGKIRGLLCYYCNLGLGQFRDDIKRVRSAIEYLKRYEDAVV